MLYIKGSPEKMLLLSNKMLIDNKRVDIGRNIIDRQFIDLAKQGYRVLALAQRSVAEFSELKNISESHLSDMTFLGLVAMIDPVRAEVYDAIKLCKTGGIGVAMVTGDHPDTAKAIALDLGLCKKNEDVVTGTIIKQMLNSEPDKLDKLIYKTRVFARIEPQQKEFIVQSFIRQGHFVAVTGDGVNDAPAMRAANAGIAMGKRGTDVAKEAADLIITDDNFPSIVDGIEQGRIVYNNIRKVIALLIAAGFSALLLFFFTAMAGLPMPMIAVQLLCLNLVANGVQDVALAFEPKEGHKLSKKPRHPNEPILERHIIEHILVTGTIMGGLAFIVYATLLQPNVSIDEARNLVLMLMVIFGNIHALSARSESRSLFSIPIFSNIFIIIAVPLAQIIHIGAMYTPGLNEILMIQPISFKEWGLLLLTASILLLVEEIHKF